MATKIRIWLRSPIELWVLSNDVTLVGSWCAKTASEPYIHSKKAKFELPKKKPLMAW